MITLPLRPSGLALLLVAAGACSSQAPSSLPSPAAPGAAGVPAAGATRAEIDAEDLRLRVGLLAHDSMRGRESGTPEKRQAAEYLAGELARLGLRPAGDGGSYFQAVPLERTTTRVDASATRDGAARPLTREDLLLVSGMGGAPASSRTAGEGSVVFAGYLMDPSPGGAELTPQQLSGAVAIVRMGAPPGVDESALAPRMAVASLFSPASPAAALLLVAEDDLEDFWDYAVDVSAKGAVALRRAGPAPAGPPIFLISPEAVERFLGASLEGARAPRTALGTLRFQLDVAVERFEDRNVVAILPGSDPARSQEFMTLGAHYDHVGVGTPVNGDSIFNGADDNASGTSALLEVAEHFAHRPQGQRLARSVLFIWHAAEESGLLGSEHFTDNPTIPRRAMVAHINMDMVGRNSPDSLFVVGSRRLSTELGDWVEEVNGQLSRPFVLDYTLDAPGHPEMIYCRSDHWNFARYGIPIVKIGSGLHDDYHAPSDTPDKLDYGKIARVAELAAGITERVANHPLPPRVDQPVPPLGTPCS